MPHTRAKASTRPIRTYPVLRGPAPRDESLSVHHDIENAPDTEACRQETQARLQANWSPSRNAHAFGIEETIDPRDTRSLLVNFIEDAWRVVQTQLGPGSGPSYPP